MDSLKSFKGYNRTEEADDRDFRRKTRKRIIIIILSSIFLLLAVSVAVSAALIHRRNSSSSSPASSAAATSLKLICNVTPHPDACISSISPLVSNMTATLDPQTIFALSLRAVAANMSSLISLTHSLSVKNDAKLKAAFAVCNEVFNGSSDSVSDSIDIMNTNSNTSIDSVRTWLTAALTNLDTCVDALDEQNLTSSETSNKLKSAIEKADALTSNSLTIVTKVLALLSKYDEPPNRRRLLTDPGEVNESYPAWVGSEQRRLLKESSPVPDFVVALDGSGGFRSIQAAIDAVVPKRIKMTVIYVKRGVYFETVRVGKDKWNVMIYGDGINFTTISGNLNFVDGTPTFHTPTFAVNGKGFVAKDLTFINTAGPIKHQAVAARISSDLSVFFRCSFIGFQDTLYTQCNRQFIRDCRITGTIDFIFGNAAVIIQNCIILPRQPLANQFNTLTAQGKKLRDMNSGIVIVSSMIIPLDNVIVPTYLGRPWKDFSTCLIMRSKIGRVVHPLGWIGWLNPDEAPDTINYVEFQNSGIGSLTMKRRKWKGLRFNLTPEEVDAFSVSSFLQAKDWLPADIPTNV